MIKKRIFSASYWGYSAAFPFLLLSRFLQLMLISSRRIFKSLDLQFEMSVHGWISFGNKLILSTILSANSGLFLFLSKINQQQSLLQYAYGSLPKFLRRCLVDSL